jgi:hypothetical protein
MFGVPHSDAIIMSCQVPPEVVCQLLWAAILFPLALQLKRVRVHRENATGAVSARHRVRFR